MSGKKWSRRSFLQTSAATTGAMAAARSIAIQPVSIPGLLEGSSVERVRFGIVGVGMQGSGLLTAADLYDGRHTLAKEIAGPKIKTTRHYQELLDNKDIDCIIAAVPDHWHKQVVVDALSAGKDVYCEKPMSHSPQDGLAMVAAAKKSGRIMQVGSQRVSSAICGKAKELLASGIIGELNLVEGYMGRNSPSGAWEYPPPMDLSPQTVDWDTWLGTAPKHEFDPRRFACWRGWKEYGTGVAGDLLVHLISGMNFMMGWNEPPARATAAGGILRWKDGRNMPDVQAVIYEYGKIPVYLRLNLGCEMPEVYRFQGSKGYLEVME